MISKTFAASDVLQLNDPNGAAVGRHVIQVSGTWTGSIKVRKGLAGTAVAYTSWPQAAYRNEAAQSDVDNTTDITANGLYTVYADGCNVALIYTRSSGTVVIEADAVRG